MTSFESGKISIITVVYNAVDLLEGTMNSVFNQTSDRIEYIIIDGASTDGTLELIKANADKIDKWLSEPDRGLYDAMNKGLDLATGDFVWFMNAGDRLFSDTTVETLLSSVREDTDVLYGEVMLVDEERNHLGTRSELTTQKLPPDLNQDSLKFGMCVCHQAFLPRKNIAPHYALNNLSADIEWVILCLRKARSTQATGKVLAEYLMGGLSKKQHRAGLSGRYKILKKYYGTLPNLINHIFILGRALMYNLKRKGKLKY